MADSESATLADAIALRRQVRRGAITGVGLATALFALFVAVPGATRSPFWYLGLAVVVAITGAGLVTLLLVAYRVHRLAMREKRNSE